MKDKILYLILGILIGVVITAGCFLVIGKNKTKGMKNGNFKPDKEMMENFENFDPENFDPENMHKIPKDGKRKRPDFDKNQEKATSESTEKAEKTE